MARTKGSKNNKLIAARGLSAELQDVVLRNGEYSLEFLGQVARDEVYDSDGERVKVPLKLRTEAAQYNAERAFGKITEASGQSETKVLIAVGVDGRAVAKMAGQLLEDAAGVSMSAVDLSEDAGKAYGG